MTNHNGPPRFSDPDDVSIMELAVWYFECLDLYAGGFYCDLNRDGYIEFIHILRVSEDTLRQSLCVGDANHE